MQKKSLMFGFVTKTWNPIVTRCTHYCKYCYAQPLLDKLMLSSGKYECLAYNPSALQLREQDLSHLKLDFVGSDYVFVCSMCDLFAEAIPTEFITKILSALKTADAQFLLLTKNPQRMVDCLDYIPSNCTLGMTAETNRATTRWSKAPLPFDRFAAFSLLANEPFERFVCIEPIMDFDLYPFAKLIHEVKPTFVSIGYDNHHFMLPEPYLSKTEDLIALLKLERIEIRAKTLREKWQ